MAKLRHRLKASTLVESMVAMVIVTVCFGIASMIYVNVMDNQRSVDRYKAHLMLTEISERIKTDEHAADGTLKEGELTVEMKITPYTDSKQASVLSLVMKDEKGIVLDERKQIIPTKAP